MTPKLNNDEERNTAYNMGSKKNAEVRASCKRKFSVVEKCVGAYDELRNNLYL